MSAQPQPRLTVEQYLELDRASEFRNEYYSGRMYAMSGGSPTHAILIASIGRELGIGLKKGSCQVATSNLRVRVSSGGLYTYPDVVVVCGKIKVADDDKDTLLNPILLLEVLSPSTEAYDRGFKFAQYRLIESLQEYALVSQTEPRVEVFRRQPGGNWLFSEAVGLDKLCRFDSVDCAIPLAEIYDKVTFEIPAGPASSDSPAN
jgi:Uma2 family endonuclease